MKSVKFALALFALPSSVADDCYTCHSPAWGWYMGPFSYSTPDTYNMNMYRSNQNGCTRAHGDPDTLTGSVTFGVSESAGNLVATVLVTTAASFNFKETQVFVSRELPTTQRMPPGKKSSKCYEKGGGTDSCLSATGSSHLHEILIDTANDAESIPITEDFYFWVHAAETTTGDTVYARSSHQCGVAPEPSLVADDDVDPVDPDLAVPEKAPGFRKFCKVKTSGGGTKDIKDVVIGDVIETADKTGTLSYSPVTEVMSDTKTTTFLNITTSTDKVLSVFHGHLMPRCNGRVDAARRMEEGDCIETTDGPETISTITSELDNEAYTVVTANDFVAVESVVASPFTQKIRVSTCFHADSQVKLESGELRKISEVKLNDKILTADEKGNFTYAKVYELPHKQNSEVAEFLELTTEKGKQLTLTPDHLLPRCVGGVVPAREFAEGDCVRTVDGSETLSKIESMEKSGVYTAITRKPFIVVDEFIASPFGLDRDVERAYQTQKRRDERTREREKLRKNLRSRK